MIQSHAPAKKQAFIYSEEDDFNLLFGQKEDLEVEGQVRTDDHLQLIQDELERNHLRKPKLISGKMTHCCGGGITNHTSPP